MVETKTNEEITRRAGRGNNISDLSFHEGLFKGKRVVVDAPQNVAVFCLGRGHQQNSFTVQSLVYFGRFLEGGGRRESGRQTHMHQRQDVGPA